jgi:hypothetical protein
MQYGCPNGLSVPPSLIGLPLVEILRCIGAKDIAALQKGVELFAPFYRYYKDNSSMSVIPTSEMKLPDGPAIEVMAKLLSVRKARGIDSVANNCLVSA